MKLRLGKMQKTIAAPEGVGWGTTNTPEKDRIDPANNVYQTRDGRAIIGLDIKLHISHANGDLHESTFPIKGSIDRGKRKQPRYAIWTLDGRVNLFGTASKDDLVLVGPKQRDMG